MAESTVAGRMKRVEGGINVAVGFVARHWLAFANTLVGIFVGLPFLAPILAALGFDAPARLMYWAYQITCHQFPHRSFFLGGPKVVYSQAEIAALTGRSSLLDLYHHPITLAGIGYQVAFCQRDVAIYGTIFLAGLAFALVRRRVRPLPFRFLLLLSLPMAVDGLVQLVGLHESTWELRVITGFLFGLGAVWFVYPRIELAMQDVLRGLHEPGASFPSA